jgi:endoribonuclease LACTB2
MERPAGLAEGVERFHALTPTLPPATHTNSYALGTRQLLLVEPATPYDDERRAWVQWARGLVSAGRELVGILLTHHHADHVGGAAFFRSELGVPLYAHRHTASRLAPEITISHLLDEGDELVLDGPEPQRWRALFTPGHAPGHLCLHEERLGALVVGDMVASVGTILVAPGDGDMRVYIEELRRLEALGAKTALPAHGEVITDPSRLFRAYVMHRLMRESLVHEAVVATGGGTLDELVPRAYGDTPEAIWPLAKLSLEAHLEKLEHEGRVRREGARWLPSSVPAD